jgi:hypothetical protein
MIQVNQVISGPIGPEDYPEGNSWMLVVSTNEGPMEVFFDSLAYCLNLDYELREGPVLLDRTGEIE